MLLEQQLEKISSDLLKTPQSLELAKPGNCRRWTYYAIVELRKRLTNFGLEIQAREIEFEPDLFHTFVRISKPDTPPGGQPYLIDGTGVGKHGPCHGSEQDIPHLSNSHSDMLNAYLDLESK